MSRAPLLPEPGLVASTVSTSTALASVTVWAPTSGTLGVAAVGTGVGDGRTAWGFGWMIR